MELDVFYTMVTETFVTSLLFRNYDVIIRISGDVQAQILDTRNPPNPLTNLIEIWYSEV